MLPTQRRQAILARGPAAQRGRRPRTWPGEFDVSVETIRRDLRDAAATTGLLERVYGGADPPVRPVQRGQLRAPGASATSSASGPSPRWPPSLVEPERDDRHRRRHHRAGGGPGAARRLPRPGAHQLGAGRDGAVRARRASSCCCPAGRSGPATRACSGAHAEAFFAEFYADRAFLGSGGVHPEAGLTDYYPAEVVVRRTIVAHTADELRARRLQQARRDRRAPGLPARPASTAVLTDDAGDADAYQACRPQASRCCGPRPGRRRHRPPSRHCPPARTAHDRSPRGEPLRM